MSAEDKQKMQVTCPACGYRMPIFFTRDAISRGVFVTCKGRGCRRTFEVKIDKGQQAK